MERPKPPLRAGQQSIDGIIRQLAKSVPSADHKITPDLLLRKAKQPNRVTAPSPGAALMSKPSTPPKPVKTSLPTNEPPLVGITLPKNFAQQTPPQDKKPFKVPNKARRWKKIIFRSALVIVALVIATGSWLGWKVVRDVDKVFGGNIISDAHALFSSTKLNGEAQGRVNILLAGDSADDPGHQGADLTDSIMVVSINTKNDTGFMLSIPRDLWVDIPGNGYHKINAAYEDGQTQHFSAPGYFNGGMGLLEKVVSQDLGIPIDYYALIDYTAFKDAVNAIGGITITINSPDPYGLYDPNADLRLPNGVVTLNGQQALNLARARGDGPGAYGFPQADFDRTQHQRQMLVAVEQKASSLGVATNPVKIGNLFDAVGNNVSTDLTLADALRAAQLSKGFNLNNLQSLTYSYGGSNPLLIGYGAADGESALIPSAGLGDYLQLQEYYKQQTSTNPVVKENASVVVLNGSDVVGLARQEANVLTSEGLDVAAVSDASTEYPYSMLVDLSGGKDPSSKQALQQLLSTGSTTVTAIATGESTEAQGYNASFVVILGKNWDGTVINSTSTSSSQ
jgi:LCP family protein required for cell wall assembly